MRRFMLLLLLIGAAVEGRPAQATVWEVSILDFEFVPSTLVVAAGDSIHWTNDGQAKHTVDSGESCTGDGEFSSGTLNSGDDFGYAVDTGDQGRTIPYFCDLHCGMGMVASYTVQQGTPTLVRSWGTIKTLYK